MRQATFNTGWILDPNGDVVGLSTGSDPCTEHECGIGGVRKALGVPKVFEQGLADRTMSRQPDLLDFHEYTLPDGTPAAWWALADSHYARSLSVSPGSDPAGPPLFSNELGFWGKRDLLCAWDEHGLIAHVRTAPEVARLRQIHEQALASNLVLGGSLLLPERKHQAGGIVLLRADKVDPGMAAQALAEDQSKVRLRAAVLALRLDEELRASGCHWYALSPRWKDASESEVVYWLNPARQSDFQCGLYTADELRQWARGEGPVMIDKPLQAKRKALAKPLEKLRENIRRARMDVPSFRVDWADESRKDVAIKCAYYHEPKPGTKRLDPGPWTLEALTAAFPDKPRTPRRKKAPAPR